MAEECLDNSSFWRIDCTGHRIVSELRFSRQLQKEGINDRLRAHKECWRISVLVVLCTSTKAIGDGGKKPFVLVAFIRSRPRFRDELLKKSNELFPTFRPVTQRRLFFCIPRLLQASNDCLLESVLSIHKVGENTKESRRIHAGSVLERASQSVERRTAPRACLFEAIDALGKKVGVREAYQFFDCVRRPARAP